MAGGGTWRIIVEEGEVKSPTQSTVGGGGSGKRKKTGVSKEAREITRVKKEIQQQVVRTSQALLGASAAFAVAGMNQYLSITGQSALKNRTNATLTYGALGIRAASQAATLNIAGAVATVAAGALLYANQRVSFQRDVAEQNANAEYLRQRSNTSTTNGRDFYRFSI